MQVRSGRTVTQCSGCSSQFIFEESIDWQYDAEKDSSHSLNPTRTGPSFCPNCGSDKVEFSDEVVDFYLYAMKCADWNINEGSTNLCKALYPEWSNEGKPDTFVQYLIDFKRASVTR